MNGAQRACKGVADWRTAAMAALLGLLPLAAPAQEAAIVAPLPQARPDTISPPAAPPPAAEPDRITPPEPPGPSVPLTDGPQPAALLRGLDTFSGHVADFTVAVGRSGRFERIIVTLEACHVVDGGADSYAFLTIADGKTPAQIIFRGWMVASSPALSALDHPRYDVWLQSCSTRSG